MHTEKTVQTESRQAAETCRLAARAPQNGQQSADLFGRHLSRDWFEHAPDIFHQNFMSGGVRMNTIR